LLGGLKRRPGLKRGEEDWPRGCAGAVGGVISTDSGWKAAETQRQECRCHARGACVVSGADVVGAPLPRWGKSEIGSGSTGCAMLRAASLHPSLHSGAPLGRRGCGVGGGYIVEVRTEAVGDLPRARALGWRMSAPLVLGVGVGEALGVWGRVSASALSRAERKQEGYRWLARGRRP
jgi:hypothetical protein